MSHITNRETVSLVKPASACGVCSECAKWNKFHCKNTYSVGTVNAWDGAMCEYVLFTARDLVKLPDNIGFEQAALIEPAANAIMAGS